MSRPFFAAPRRRLLALFVTIGVAAFVGTIAGARVITQGTFDGIRVLAREKSLAEQFVVLLNNFGRKDIRHYAKGIALYAEAKAEFDGLITELEHELQHSRPPNQSKGFESALKKAVAKRIAFTSFVTDTLIPKTDGAQKGPVGDFIKGSSDLIRALTDSGITIWREFRSSSETRRKEIRQELESLRWPQFTARIGKQD